METDKKSNVWAILALLALAFAASVASFSTTLDGTRRIFPDKQLTQGIAIILALVVQAALLLLPFLRDRFRSKARSFAAITAIGCSLLLSTSTSFLSYISNFTAEESRVARQYTAWSTTRSWISELLVQSRSAIDVVVAAEKEREAALPREIRGDGEFRSVVNSYLRSLVWDESALPGVDRQQALQGDGVRAQFLRDLEHELEANKLSLERSITGIDQLIQSLDNKKEASIQTVNQFYFRARDLEESDLLIRIYPDYRENRLPFIDETIFSPVTSSKQWQEHFTNLFNLEPRSIGFFVLALVLDCFIVVFSSLASDERPQSVREKLGINHILEPIYREQLLHGIQRWVTACEPSAIEGNEERFHVVAIDMLGEELDHKAERALRKLGVLKRRRLVGGEVVSTLSASAYSQLRSALELHKKWEVRV